MKRRKKKVKRKSRKIPWQTTTTFLVVFGMIFEIGWQAFNGYMSATYSTQNLELDKMRETIRRIQDQNGDLRSQILHYEALTTIYNEATAAGFVDGSNNVLYLK